MNGIQQQELNEQFLAAVKEEIVEEIIRLIEDGADVNTVGEDGGTPLHFAAENGYVGIVELLIEKGADIDAIDQEDGRTPLHFAAENGYVGIVELLIEKGADIDAIDQEDGRTPLHFAAKNGHVGIVELLIKKGADIDAIDQEDGRTPLHFAAENGHVDIVELLIKKGADIDAKNKDGWTPLHFVAENGHVDIVELLIKKGADIDAKNKDGWTPLHFVVENGHVDIVRSLIEKGAGVNAAGRNIWISNSWTLYGGLLYGWTPLHSAAKDGYVGIVNTLLQVTGINVNATDQDGRTPLHFAAENGHADVVRSLIEKGADVNATDQDGRTPLHFAAENGHADVVRSLIEKGADVNATDQDGRTPLHFAAENGHADVVRSLIEKGADVNAVDQDGRTPLQYAVNMNYKETIITLIDKGADINRLLFIRNNESYEIIVHYIAKLEAAGLYISLLLVEGKETFLDTSHYRRSNYLQHCRNCKREVQEIEKEDKLLHDFLKESDIEKLVSIFEASESVRSKLNNQEGLKKQYLEYAYILINKADKVKKEIFLHNHRPLIDILPKGYKEDVQKMSFAGMENFFMFHRKDYSHFQWEMGIDLINLVDFEDVKERHIPTLKVKTFVKMINNQDINSSLKCPSTEQTQGASQSLN